MNSYLKKIFKNHIEAAIELIKSKSLNKENHVGYDLVMIDDDERYSPRQATQIAYQITPKKEEYVYDIEEIKHMFREHGYYLMKKNIWKLDCNWEESAPSFYEVLIKNNIVICANSTGYFQENNLILITEGIIVRALARVIKNEGLLSKNNTLKETFQKYRLNNPDQISLYEAEIYQLPSYEIFEYSKIQIERINDESVRNRVINSWDDKDSLLNKVFFQRRASFNLSNTKPFPFFYLLKNHGWDDFEYKTTYNLSFAQSYRYEIEIGTIKIFKKNKKHIELAKSFNRLNEDYCSLGQTAKFYKSLSEIFPQDYERVLSALRDIASDKSILEEFKDEEGFNKSLLRSSEAELVLEQYDELFYKEAEDKEYNFTFSTQVNGAIQEHQVGFAFGNIKELDNRFYGIIGKNATGKTKYLSDFVNKLVNVNEQGEFKPKRPTFSKIISASFSYFDNFKFPEDSDISYEFIGIKDKDGLIDDKKYKDIIWNSYRNVVRDREAEYLATSNNEFIRA